MTARFVGWLMRAPADRAQAWSLSALTAASAVALVDTTITFQAVLSGEAVRIPRLDGYSLDWTLAAATLGLWAVGAVLLAIPSTRRPLGWLAPVGVIGAALLDRQTLAGSVLYLVALGSAMHWWAALLADSRRLSRLRGAPLRVMQSQVSIVFAWATFAKLNPRFMSGGVLSVSFAGPVPVPDFVLDRRVLVTMALLTVVSEALFAVGLWMRKLRRPLLVAAALFHSFIVAFFSPTLALIGFALAMGAGYALFADEPWATSADGAIDPTIDRTG